MKYNIKFYEEKEEKETVRGLKYSQMVALTQALDRLGVQYKIIEVNTEKKAELFVVREREDSEGEFLGALRDNQSDITLLKKEFRRLYSFNEEVRQKAKIGINRAIERIHNRVQFLLKWFTGEDHRMGHPVKILDMDEVVLRSIKQGRVGEVRL